MYDTSMRAKNNYEGDMSHYICKTHHKHWWNNHFTAMKNYTKLSHWAVYWDNCAVCTRLRAVCHKEQDREFALIKHSKFGFCTLSVEQQCSSFWKQIF